jgi:hypothetical protein
MLQAQRDFILERVKLNVKSQTVYDPLAKDFKADRQKSALKSELLAMIRKNEERNFAWPFREPVDTNEVADYLDVIKEPIDHYKSKQMLFADLMLMVNNCKLNNEEVSLYVQCAVNLESFLSSMFLSIQVATCTYVCSLHVCRYLYVCSLHVCA